MALYYPAATICRVLPFPLADVTIPVLTPPHAIHLFGSHVSGNREIRSPSPMLFCCWTRGPLATSISEGWRFFSVSTSCRFGSSGMRLEGFILMRLRTILHRRKQNITLLKFLKLLNYCTSKRILIFINLHILWPVILIIKSSY